MLHQGWTPPSSVHVMRASTHTCAPALQVVDINVPPQPASEEDTVQTRLAAWSGFPSADELLDKYEVVSAATSCVCLRRKGKRKEEVSAVMLEFRREGQGGAGGRRRAVWSCACMLPTSLHSCTACECSAACVSLHGCVVRPTAAAGRAAVLN